MDWDKLLPLPTDGCRGLTGFFRPPVPRKPVDIEMTLGHYKHVHGTTQTPVSQLWARAPGIRGLTEHFNSRIATTSFSKFQLVVESKRQGSLFACLAPERTRRAATAVKVTTPECRLQKLRATIQKDPRGGGQVLKGDGYLQWHCTRLHSSIISQSCSSHYSASRHGEQG